MGSLLPKTERERHQENAAGPQTAGGYVTAVLSEKGDAAGGTWRGGDAARIPACGEP